MSGGHYFCCCLHSALQHISAYSISVHDMIMAIVYLSILFNNINRKVDTARVESAQFMKRALMNIKTGR